MAAILDQPRSKCALAAIQTAQAIPGVLPILHAGPGCAYKLVGNRGTSGRFAANVFPCTNVGESEIVFGGEEKLRENIQSALKVIDADLYMVFTGCTTEIVGDDVQQIVESYADEVKPVLYVSAPGFKGSNYLGYEWVLEALIRQYMQDAPAVRQGLVNIWGGVPFQDPSAVNDLRVLESLIAKLGFQPNTIFGNGRGVNNVNIVPAAEYNVLVSPWAGLSTMKLLKERFGTPFFHYPVRPVGAVETSAFLRAFARFASVDAALVEPVIASEEDRFYYYLEQWADSFLEETVTSQHFSIAADAYTALGIAKFLVNNMGFIPEMQFITDDPPEEYREAISKYFSDNVSGIPMPILFEDDGYQIKETMKRLDYVDKPLIIGSFYEKQVAAELRGSYLETAWPVVERRIIVSSYVGYDGGLRLLEDLTSPAVKTEGRMVYF
ncbi:MAG: hydrogenase [Peptococcaceae bacterium]|jgi:nitrogenase molybdenum-iron protein beta chain|nr:hydrogenase [Peptococcaceae bacterium]